MLNPPYILDLSHAELIFIHKSLMDVIPAKAGIQEIVAQASCLRRP